MKKLLIVLSICLGVILCLFIFYYLNVKIAPPTTQKHSELHVEVKEVEENHYRTSNGSWLKKNDKGSWELFLKGKPFELGVNFGELTVKLSEEKEIAFISEIEKKIPSNSYLNFLKYVVGWFNRDLDEYIPRDYLLEVYGSSAYLPDKYDYISEKYQRALNYHAAHDIGHMLESRNLVGCTSFATWSDKSENKKLLIGRNFDFYFGEDFAKDKITAFYKPDKGFQFMSVTWAGFSGVVSGMNEKGLTVTLNSASSEIPSKGKTPVSFIAREILQYASNIEEAFTIAKGFDSFIAETFLIGSKEDKMVGLIEKTPDTTTLYLQNNKQMIVTNHFQSNYLQKDKYNIEYVNEKVSPYRYKRVNELMDSLSPIDVNDVATILRNKKGLNGKDIGLANEKAVNQLIAHHSIIFSPEEMMVWVANSPYQLGDYLAYNLNEIFADSSKVFSYSPDISLEADSFLYTTQYTNYKRFVEIKGKIQNYIHTNKGEGLDKKEVDEFVESNPNSYLTYYYLGDYFLDKENWKEAEKYFKVGLNKEIARISEKEHMQEGLNKAINNQ